MSTETPIDIEVPEPSASELPPPESVATKDVLGAADGGVPPPPGGGAPPNRGSLEIEMLKPSQPIVAGRKFALTLRVKNPYDVPVTLKSVTRQLSPDFQERAPKPPGQKRGFWDYVWTNTESRLLGSAYARSLERSAPRPEGDARDLDEPESVELQPRSQTLQSFTLKTRRKILFSPSTYDFAFEAVYEVDGLERRDAAFTQLSIQAPLSAMLVGAAVGALCGQFLRNVSVWNPGVWWESFADAPIAGAAGLIASASTSVIAALVGVVAFGRQKSAQPFITIEDFYGGLFIGFVAGYTGAEFLDMFTPSAEQATGAASAPS
jgi:hypothetical protein